MTFKDWLFSNRKVDDSINGAWGTLHIVTLVACVLLIVALAFLFRKKDEKSRRIVMFTIATIIFIFEISRRVINFAKHDNITFDDALYFLLPRPWCAISCWVMMASVIVNKKFFYNYASVTSLLCAIIFFAYPMAGFTNETLLYENTYSIVTHVCLLVGSITMITLRLTDFQYKGAWKELICLAVTYVYATIEIVAGIESDPLYFMPGNDAQDILGMNNAYWLYLILYIVFIAVYCSAFYFTQWTIEKKKSAAVEAVAQSVAGENVEEVAVTEKVESNEVEE